MDNNPIITPHESSSADLIDSVDNAHDVNARFRESYLPSCFLNDNGKEWIEPRIFLDGHNEETNPTDRIYALERQGANGYDEQQIPYVRNQPLVTALDIFKQEWENYCLDPDEETHRLWQQKFFFDGPDPLLTDQIEFQSIIGDKKEKEEDKEKEDETSLNIADTSFYIPSPAVLLTQTMLTVPLNSYLIQENIRAKLPTPNLSGESSSPAEAPVEENLPFAPNNIAFTSAIQALASIPQQYEAYHRPPEAYPITSFPEDAIKEYAYYLNRRREVLFENKRIEAIIENHPEMVELKEKGGVNYHAHRAFLVRRIHEEFNSDPLISAADKLFLARYKSHFRKSEEQLQEANGNLKRLHLSYPYALNGKTLAQTALHAHLEENFLPLSSPHFQKELATFTTLMMYRELIIAIKTKLEKSSLAAADTLERTSFSVVNERFKAMDMKYTPTLYPQFKPPFSNTLGEIRVQAKRLADKFVFSKQKGQDLALIHEFFKQVNDHAPNTLSLDQLETLISTLEPTLSLENNSIEERIIQETERLVGQIVGVAGYKTSIQQSDFEAKGETLKISDLLKVSHAPLIKTDAFVNVPDRLFTRVNDNRGPGLSSSSPFQYRFKVIGSSESGKSSLIMSYVNGIFSPYLGSQGFGAESKFKELNQSGHAIRIELCDNFKSFNIDAFVICVDLTNRDSFVQLKNYLREIQHFAMDTSPVLLVATKVDLVKANPECQQVSFAEFEEFCNDTNHCGVYTSSKERLNVVASFALLTALTQESKSIEPRLESSQSSVSALQPQKKSLLKRARNFFKEKEHTSMPSTLVQEETAISSVSRASSTSLVSASFASKKSWHEHPWVNVPKRLQEKLAPYVNSSVQNDLEISTAKKEMDETSEKHLKFELVGEERTGKSSLIVRYVYNTFTNSYISSQGSKCKHLCLDDRNFQIEVADVMPHNIHERFPRYMPVTHGFVLCFDITNRSTFEYLPYTIAQLRHYANKENTPIILVATKLDRVLDDPNSAQVSFEEFEALAKKEKCMGVSTSSKSGMNIDLAFATLTAAIVEKNKLVEEETADIISGVPREQGGVLRGVLNRFFSGSSSRKESSSSESSQYKP